MAVDMAECLIEEMNFVLLGLFSVLKLVITIEHGCVMFVSLIRY
jgi:hypothetical protein